MFDAYNIEFNTDLITKIKECAVFPSDSLPEAAQIQDTSAENDCQMLSLKKKTTLHELQALLLDVRHILHPVEGYLPTFDHFHLQSSQLFIAYMNEQIPQSGTATSVGMLKKALINVRNDFESLLKGTATRQSVLFQIVAKVDSIEEEIGKLVLYKEFSMYKSSRVLENIKNALIIPGVIEGAKSLLMFCTEFELKKSLQSGSFQQLQKVCKEMDEATMQHMTLEMATEIIEKIKKILKSGHQNVKIDYLPVLKNLNNRSIQIKQFFIDNNFTVKNRHQFQQKYELVTEQLQCSAKGLSNLCAILNLLSPLNNPAELTLFDILAIFSKLDEADIYAQFTSVINDIDLIKMWFSRIEVCNILLIIL